MGTVIPIKSVRFRDSVRTPAAPGKTPVEQHWFSRPDYIINFDKELGCFVISSGGDSVERAYTPFNNAIVFTLF